MSDHSCSIYLESNCAVYIDIAKVASSSLKATFTSVVGLAMQSDDPHEINFPSPPIPDASKERLYPGLYTFAFVRNPWDRLVSCYRDKIVGEVSDFTEFSDKGLAHCLSVYDEFSANMTFKEFVYAVNSIPDNHADEHFRSQFYNLVNASGEIAIDFIGRFEKLDFDFSLIVKQIGLPESTTLPRLQAASKPVRYSDYYTDTTRKIVAERYERDIRYFFYIFE